METRLLEERITRAVIDAFRNVHRVLGFGFREYIYSLALERELIAHGHQVDREVGVMVYYRGEPLARQNMDMIVDQKVVVENKTGERLDPNAPAQLSSCLSATNLEVGLVLYFGREPRFKRVICENRLKHRTEPP